MTNQINQQSNPDPKRKAIASLVLGIISVGLLLLLYGIIGATIILGIMEMSGMGVFLMSLLFGALLSALVGLILGILSLKSTKRNFAIAGIILSAIGLLVLLYYFLII